LPRAITPTLLRLDSGRGGVWWVYRHVLVQLQGLYPATLRNGASSFRGVLHDLENNSEASRLNLPMINSQNTVPQPSTSLTNEEQMSLLNSFLNGPTNSNPEGIFINLTAMCRAFGKHAGHYLAYRQSKGFIAYWAQETGTNPSRLVIKSGHTKPIAWVDRRIAVECALGLSAHFAVWYYGVMLETPGRRLLPYEEVLQALASKVDAQNRLTAQRLKEIRNLNDPNRIPGLPWPPRRVRAAPILEEDA